MEKSGNVIKRKTKVIDDEDEEDFEVEEKKQTPEEHKVEKKENSLNGSAKKASNAENGNSVKKNAPASSKVLEKNEKTDNSNKIMSIEERIKLLKSQKNNLGNISKPIDKITISNIMSDRKEKALPSKVSVPTKSIKKLSQDRNKTSVKKEVSSKSENLVLFN